MTVALNIFVGVTIFAHLALLFPWFVLRSIPRNGFPVPRGPLTRKFGTFRCDVVYLASATMLAGFVIVQLMSHTDHGGLGAAISRVPLCVLLGDDLFRRDRPRKRRLAKLVAKLKKFSPPKLLPRPVARPLPRPV